MQNTILARVKEIKIQAENMSFLFLTVSVTLRQMTFAETEKERADWFLWAWNDERRIVRDDE